MERGGDTWKELWGEKTRRKLGLHKKLLHCIREALQRTLTCARERGRLDACYAESIGGQDGLERQRRSVERT